jgi:putative ABC transport system permease protein
MMPYVLKSLWRNRVRTLLTVSGSAVALLVFSVVGAVWEGFDRVDGGDRGDRTLVVFQANRFCPATSHLPEDYGRTIAQLPGVAEVMPIQVYTNNCRASLDVIVFHGVLADQLRSHRPFKLVDGDWGRFQSRQDAALVGRAVAGRRGLDVGQKFTIGEVSVTVAGVFAAETPSEENLIYTHLAFLQRTPGLNAVGSVTQFEVGLADDTNADAVCTAVDEHFRGGPVPTDTRLKGAFQAGTLADLADLLGMLRWLGYACIGLVLALVAATTVMTVHDRVGEHALLQTIGFSSRRVFGLILTESVLMSLAGGLVGVMTATLLLAEGNLAVGAEAVTIAVRPSLGLTAIGLTMSAGVGVLAGLVPAWQAARADIVASLRER